MTDPMTRHLNVYFPQMRTVSPQMMIQSWISEHYHQHINPGRILRLQWFQTGPIVSFLAQRLGWKPCLFLLSPCDSGILWNTDSFLLGTAWLKPQVRCSVCDPISWLWKIVCMAEPSFVKLCVCVHAHVRKRERESLRVFTHVVK